MGPEQAGFGLSQFSLRDTILEETCPANPNCEDAIRSKFRTADGSCNNLQNPLWGRSGTQTQRVIAPNYADGSKQNPF